MGVVKKDGFFGAENIYVLITFFVVALYFWLLLLRAALFCSCFWDIVGSEPPRAHVARSLQVRIFNQLRLVFRTWQ